MLGAESQNMKGQDTAISKGQMLLGTLCLGYYRWLLGHHVLQGSEVVENQIVKTAVLRCAATAAENKTIYSVPSVILFASK